MSLRIQELWPVYFTEAHQRASQIWKQDIRFEKGSRVHIVAPSGSGKTSLIHFLYGTRSSYTGSIQLNEFNITGMKPAQKAVIREKQLSVVFQDLRLFPTLSVYENINIKRQLNPYHSEDMIPVMVERLGITHKLHQLCSTCSYGEQQRVAIIRSLMQPFDFILLDEPFSHLDKENSQKALDLILEEADKRGAGVLLADLEELPIFPYQALYHL
ncbi:MAG: ATP-binding cassette domain-containing protein [Chitinophagaceae bacterium]|uniref:ATP-binding cassette domain-containing protein n=1 Tax=unclassified Paraflavitalea TaxID=2798305 RepID=UPI003D333B7F|nr:ATP-binding cassette domain-containing protein [Chitinophagaceae bacterium]